MSNNSKHNTSRATSPKASTKPSKHPALTEAELKARRDHFKKWAQKVADGLNRKTSDLL